MLDILQSLDMYFAISCRLFSKSFKFETPGTHSVISRDSRLASVPGLPGVSSLDNMPTCDLTKQVLSAGIDGQMADQGPLLNTLQ